MNIKDIAKLAGVSPATVSFVLNNKKGVGEETRKKILDIIEQVNYIPNSVARNLASGKSRSIGVIVPDMSESYCSLLVRAITNYFSKIGYLTLITNSDLKPDEEVKCFKYLMQNGVEGAIIIPSSQNPYMIKTEFNFPIVCVDGYIKGMDFDYVGINNYEVSYTAVSHLLKLGYKKVRCIWAGGNLTCLQERVDGYLQAMTDFGLADNNSKIIQAPDVIETGKIVAKELFVNNDIPQAVFITGDLCAIGVCEYILEKGLRIPEDIAVIGFDDTPFAKYYKIPLTTIHQPVQKIAQKALSMLYNRILGQPSPTQTIRLEADFIIRESCGYKKRHEAD